MKWRVSLNFPYGDFNVNSFRATLAKKRICLIGLEDTSESFGLPATADLMFALITSDELEDLDQLVVKQLKNRYNDPTIFKRFVIGIDRSRMKLYDCEQEAQEELIDSAENDYDDSIPVADRGRDRYTDFKI